MFLGAKNPTPSTEYVDFVPGSADAATPEQEQRQQQQEEQQQQQQQQPGKLQKGDNGCPTMFSKALCDPGEGVTVITKAALPGFLNLDKCRQSMLSHLSCWKKEKGKKRQGKTKTEKVQIMIEQILLGYVLIIDIQILP